MKSGLMSLDGRTKKKKAVLRRLLLLLRSEYSVLLCLPEEPLQRLWFPALIMPNTLCEGKEHLPAALLFAKERCLAFVPPGQTDNKNLKLRRRTASSPPKVPRSLSSADPTSQPRIYLSL